MEDKKLEMTVQIANYTHWSREEIGSLHPVQFIEVYNEIMKLKKEEEHKKYSFYNVLLSTIHNAPILKPKILKPEDFYQLEETKVDKRDTIDKNAEALGIILPKE